MRLPSDPETAAEHACWWLLAAAVILSALVATPAGDTFRLPKDAVVRSAAIALISIAALFAIWVRYPDWLRLGRSRWLVIPVAVVAWTLITFAFAENHRTAIAAVVDALASVTLFLFAVVLLRRRSVLAFGLVALPAALVNVVVIVLQWRHVWEPFIYTIDVPDRLRRTAMIGNPDDVGMYFAPVVIAAAALAIATKRPIRFVAALVAMLGIGAVVIAQTLTALAAIGVGLVAMLIVLFRRRALAAVALLVVAGGVVLFVSEPGHRLTEMATQLRHGQVPVAISGRAVMASTAIEMFKDAPLFGVGPGNFAWEFFPYKLKVEERTPALRSVMQENAGEAHNDHLQMLAEGGVPGYAIYVIALIALAAISFREGDDDRARFARFAALPLAVTFAVLGLASFPLHVASARTIFLFAAAAATAWSHEREADA